MDLWLEAFHRLEGATLGGSGQGRASRLGGRSGAKAKNGADGGGQGAGGKSKRPRWSGVVGHVVYGLAPLVAVAALWRVSPRSVGRLVHESVYMVSLRSG